jgi:hypothetical protein
VGASRRAKAVNRIDGTARAWDELEPVSKRVFTAQAELLWYSIPAAARERIPKNVFCRKCRGASEMVDFTGSEKNGDLVLEGACAKCGQRAVRVVETSEAAPPNN